jgi:hypothetical protein
MPKASVKRVPLSLNVPPSVVAALDRRVEEGRAQGFPVDRAPLAVVMLERALAGGAPSPGGRVPMTPEVDVALDDIVTFVGDLDACSDGSSKTRYAVAEIRKRIAVAQ